VAQSLWQYCVAHPIEIPGFQDFLERTVLSDKFKLSSDHHETCQQQWIDPFSTLPEDVHYIIMSYLPGESVIALRMASSTIRITTSHNLFWKRLIFWDMPWFWELKKILEEQSSFEFDFRRLYLWANKMTIAEFGMEGPFLGIANRRRIWRACQQIARGYHTWKEEPADGYDDKHQFMKYAQCLQMPSVLHPRPKGKVSQTSKCQWIYSWNEIDTRPSTFETFWNADETLVGLAVTFGRSQRVLGRTDRDAVGNERITWQSRRIAATDWISGLVLHIPHLSPLNDSASTAIKGLSVSVCASRNKQCSFSVQSPLTATQIIFRESGRFTFGLKDVVNLRPLIVSEDIYLVGVTGHIEEVCSAGAYSTNRD
jgi:hypothetical protein